MAEKSRLKVSILNRYFPPNSSVTGNSAFELHQWLGKNSELDVYSVSISANYKGAKSESSNLEGNYFIPAYYQGNNKALRFFFNLVEGYKLVKKALLIESDVVITLTDPPLLNFWASRLLSKRKKVKWINWTMDLYPDAFVSAGLVASTNAVYKYFYNTIRNNVPDLIIALGYAQKEFLISEYYGKNSQFVILPCGIHEELKSENKPGWLSSDKIIFSYAGNLGEAHSDKFLLNFITLLDSDKHHLVLSVYGSKAGSVQKLVKNKNFPVTIVNSVSKEDFSYIDIHLVSLLPEWTNICVPSKAVSAICAKSTVLFYGDKKADTYQMLNSASFYISYSSNEHELINGIKSFLNNLTNISILDKRSNSCEIAQKMVYQKAETFKEIAAKIELWRV